MRGHSEGHFLGGGNEGDCVGVAVRAIVARAIVWGAVLVEDQY